MFLFQTPDRHSVKFYFPLLDPNDRRGLLRSGVSAVGFGRRRSRNKRCTVAEIESFQRVLQIASHDDVRGQLHRGPRASTLRQEAEEHLHRHLFLIPRPLPDGGGDRARQDGGCEQQK